MPELNHGDLALSSPAFEAHSSIPDAHAAANDGPSPALDFISVPDATRELVLIVHDPDAPLVDGFIHGVALGIDPAATGLSKGAIDESLAELQAPTRREVRDRIEGHILEQARSVGTWTSGD